METKEELVNNIKEWIKIDNEIRALKKELNARNAEKKNISKELMEVMKTNEIDCFDINNGKIMYVKKNVKKPISAKALLGIISNYYDGDTEKASDLNNYILSNREEVVKEAIVRK
jgi:seryl-tRNA synthetase